MPSRLFILLGLAAGLAPALAFASERPVVVELFTSQGCSSCPPANAFLNDLTKNRADVLPLGFHVTYWDRLGWKDPFSLEAATQRQDRYGHRFGDGSYTPEIVVDGHNSHVGSNRQEIEIAIERAKHESQTAAAVSIKRAGNRLSVDIGNGTGRARVLLIGFDRHHTTPIRRGENTGRTFEESNVVRSIQSIADWSGAALHADAAQPQGEEAAVILEAPDGRIVGAARVKDAT
jgi:hypothetical protein